MENTFCCSAVIFRIVKNTASASVWNCKPTISPVSGLTMTIRCSTLWKTVTLKKDSMWHLRLGMIIYRNKHKAIPFLMLSITELPHSVCDGYGRVWTAEMWMVEIPLAQHIATYKKKECDMHSFFYSNKIIRPSFRLLSASKQIRWLSTERSIDVTKSRRPVRIASMKSATMAKSEPAW